MPTLELKATEIASDIAAGAATPEPTPVAAAGEPPVDVPTPVEPVPTGEAVPADTASPVEATAPLDPPPPSPPMDEAPPPPPPPDEPPPEGRPPPPPPPPPPGRSGRAWPVMGAALAGTGGALLGGLLVWWLLPASNSAGDLGRALTPRFAALEQQVRAIADRPPPATAPGVDPKALDELSARLAKLENASAPPAADPQALNELSARLAKLENAPPPPAPPAPAPDPALVGRIDALEGAVRPLPDAVAALTKRADETAAALREARSRADANAAALGELKDAARAAAGDRQQIEALAGRIAALESADRAVEAELAKRAADGVSDKGARLALAAGVLRAAVERGDPFAKELEVLKPLAGDSPALAELAPFAGNGVPSAAALARELQGLMPALRDAAGVRARENSGGSIIDRLQANAQKLVRIRPVDETPGDDQSAVLSRVEARAAAADIPSALAELKQLSAQVRAPAQDWIAKAEARNRVIAASRQLTADAVAALKTAP